MYFVFYVFFQQIPSASCPNLTKTPDSVLWNQMTQNNNNNHLNNNTNVVNRNTNYPNTVKQQFDQGNPNSLFWSTPTPSARSYQNSQQSHLLQTTSPHASGQNSSLFSSSLSPMQTSSVAENYDFGIDTGMRELKMRFESDLEEHDKQWEQRSTSNSANNQLYASSIRQ